jgi:hypothetical protein
MQADGCARFVKFNLQPVAGINGRLNVAPLHVRI